MKVRTNRSLLAYIIFTILTFGIYGIWFIWRMKEDVNIICREDGKNTPGLIVMIILSAITCGIYQLVWWYQLCERISEYEARRNMPNDINGVKYLLWSIIGTALCGIGGFVAMYLLIKGMNNISLRHNAGGSGVRVNNRPSSNNTSSSGSNGTSNSGSGSRGRLSDFAASEGSSNSGSDSFGNGGSNRGGTDSFGNGGGSRGNSSGKTDSFGNPIN